MLSSNGTVRPYSFARTQALYLAYNDAMRYYIDARPAVHRWNCGRPAVVLHAADNRRRSIVSMQGGPYSLLHLSGAQRHLIQIGDQRTLSEEWLRNRKIVSRASER